ncbi:MAG TPA: hypothetical protein VE130_02390 [Nitrososphaeraceae archaeon]|nr:hypothetical protein [Nitrososphaeraceae archaeon]
MTENERSIDMPSMQQIVIVAVASVLLISTVAFSQYALALVNSQITDLDVVEAVEAENATMAGATNQTTDIQFLAIQSAQSGSVSPVNATAYTLELNNVANMTIQFSDRPNRIVETVSTADFVGNWSAGQNSFSVDVPNDALIVENTETGQLETAVIESFSPVYDNTMNTLTYTIMAENGTSIDLPREVGQTVLVIDNSSNNSIIENKVDNNNNGICC